MEIRVLGPVEVRADGAVLDLGTPRQRAIVAALALAGGATVPVDTLIARVWGDTPPAGALATLHGYIAKLRRGLEPRRAPREAPQVLVTVDAGYALRLGWGDSDAAALEQAVAEARGLLVAVPDHLRPRVDPTDQRATSELERAVAVVDGGLARWRGRPYDELSDDPDAVAERARLADLRSAADELRCVALLALGRHAEVVGTLGAMTAAHPLHERWWALHAVALARSGRQADALAALHDLRTLLADELGVDPSPAVRDLQTALLRQDPSVGWQSSVSDAVLDVAPKPHLPEPAAPATRRRFREGPPLPRWPLAGRRPELDRLVAALAHAASGLPQAAVVVGEAGVGKSRLVLELAGLAFERGFTVAYGTCSPDGPPPLWPWRTLVTSLARQLDDVPAELVDAVTTAPPDDFTTWDAVASGLCRLAARRPLLLVVEDAHWADAATARLLVRLTDTTLSEPLYVVTTVRREPTAGPVLVELTAALARRPGVRLDLGGLDLDAASLLVGTIAGDAHLDAAVPELWQHSGGNPFYLSEMALAGGQVSGSMSDAVLARVRALPATAVRALEAASVVDHVFDHDLVGAMVGVTEAEVVDHLAPAHRAGLVVDGPVPSTYQFPHGVVRTVLHDAQPATQRAAWHRAVATTIERLTPMQRADQRAALAHHWGQAGHTHRGEAWRSVLRAAEVARGQSAYAEESEHLRHALAWQDGDHASPDRERFELLMLLADACRWGGDWAGVSDAVDEAVLVAERLDDVQLAARAAISTVEGALWQVRPFGQVHSPIVEALERVHARLDPADPLHARAAVALAVELYYGEDVERIDALVEEAIAATERCSEPRLRAVVHLGAFVARSRPDAAVERRRHAEVARAAAVEADDPRTRLLAETLLVTVAAELGDADHVRADLDRVLRLTRDRGLTTAEAVLHALAVAWRTMEGRAGDAQDSLDRLGELAAGLRMPNLVDAVGASTVVRSVLAGQHAQLAASMEAYADGSTVPAGPVSTVVALRAGETDLARRLHAREELVLGSGSFMALIDACLACEIALRLDLPDLAARAYPLALPYAGRMCSAGSAAPLGPVDTYLGWGARALGDDDAAARHLAEGRRLAGVWRLPALVDLLDRLEGLEEPAQPLERS